MPIDPTVIAQFYRGLLDLRFTLALEQVLHDAVAAIDARVGYLELWNEQAEPEFVRIVGGKTSTIQERISRGIISKAIVEGNPIVTTSALADARFHELDSVRQHEIRSVWCSPILGEETLGVLYFEGNRDAFTRLAVEDIRRLLREIELVAGRIVVRSTRTLEELTKQFRSSVAKSVLERHDWNVTSAAKELGVTRKTFYRALRDT